MGMGNFRPIWWSLLSGLMWALSVSQVLAQRTLEVRSGQIWLDGQLVALAQQDSQLLVSPDLSLQLRFFGEESPVFSLNGQFLQVKGNRVVEVAPQQLFDRKIFMLAAPANDTTDRMETVIASLVKQAQALQEEAERIYGRVAAWRDSALEEHLVVLRQQAAALSQQAQLLPQLEWETYLMYMQRQDAELARQLAAEWHWEARLQHQAARIRQLPEGPERTQAIAELYQQLEEVFERKQQNRRREIAQLELQLRLLRERLTERERYRQQIIEQRLRELLGEH